MIPKGFKLNGIKEDYGLSIIYSEKEAVGYGVFTQNRVKAYPVLISQELIKKKDKFRVIVANSGNANCYNKNGLLACKEMIKDVSKYLDVNEDDVLIASTGVIGRDANIEKLKDLVYRVSNLVKKESNVENTAKAIMTTDKFPKYIAKSLNINGKEVKILGIAKGAGMIHPNMATMLCFIITDLKIDREELKEVTDECVNKTFNNISVDGDTSTNDTVFILANGECGIDYNECKEEFKKALYEIMDYLAKKIVEDGEGATKLVEVVIKNAKNVDDAKKAGKAVINSLLVKTALFGNDPNWGRILAAVGYSGADFKDIDIILSNYKEDVYLVKNNEPLAVGGEILKKAENIIKNKKIKIIIDLKVGDVEEKFYGCDLSYEYVKINAEYTT
ncbi:bifunctional ornithine acetyltransferase/N-acetylglutamate synthase [Methanocaldococcus indicus]|uniref:bifunctional ornithine acetyltransferase/N-acetylglutamate synthase n=1 Tax=Methanocaldococcus indicus TaxID=213231 RepID=UPI003C6DB609